MNCSWTHDHYRYCLQLAQDQGYTIVPLHEAESISAHQRLIILRHDLDWSMPRALDMARTEHDLGIRATYFVRVHAPDYNIFAYKTYLALKEIHSLGHELGLHFEAIDFSHITGEDALEIFLREKEVLETVLQVPIVSAAAHGEHTTAGEKHNRSFFENISKEQVGIKYDSYDPAYFKEMKYLSDSFGFWREGCMCHHLGKYPRLQILVHPNWWFKNHLFD